MSRSAGATRAQIITEQVRYELHMQLSVYGRRTHTEVLRHMARLEEHYFTGGDDEASGRALRALYIELLGWPVPRCEPLVLIEAWRRLQDELGTL
ncbi:MAG: hypothetical protein KC492_45340, partial [Myxococcales bacterium]|nr:hypothetical protein [Myxococcales bacterium]